MQLYNYKFSFSIVSVFPVFCSIRLPCGEWVYSLLCAVYNA